MCVRRAGPTASLVLSLAALAALLPPACRDRQPADSRDQGARPSPAEAPAAPAATDPYEAVLQLCRTDGAEGAAQLHALVGRVEAADGALVEALARSAEANEPWASRVPKVAELLEAWSRRPASSFADQRKVVGGLAALGNDPGTPEALRSSLMARAVRVASRSPERWPGLADAHRLHGAILGMNDAPMLESLKALGRCLELDAGQTACRQMFQEIGQKYEAPHCAGAALKPVRWRQAHQASGPGLTEAQLEGARVWLGAVVLEPTDVTRAVELDGSAWVQMTEAGRQRVAPLLTRLPAGSTVVIEVDGLPRARFQWDSGPGHQLMKLPGLGLDSVCQRRSTTQLAPELRRWLQPAAPERGPAAD